MENHNQTPSPEIITGGPAFSVRDNRIFTVNSAARDLPLQPGMALLPLLHTGREEYEAFTGGYLYLTLTLEDQVFGAAVTRQDGQDLFLLDAVPDEALRAMALAARELRDPLCSLMIAADRLEPQNESQQYQLSCISRSILQLQRILGNMSDAGQTHPSVRMEIGDYSAFFRELLEKAQTLTANSGLTLTYQGLSDPVFGRMDREVLERAVWNMLNNAIKFTPDGGEIQARLTRKGKLLAFQVQDSGSGIPQGRMQDLFHRYQRQPGIEDSRYGVGLGMVLIRNAATQHGGTVLIDQPAGSGTRITLTLPMRQDGTQPLRSPRVDYAGEQDHGLLELSEFLPPEWYRDNR